MNNRFIKKVLIEIRYHLAYPKYKLCKPQLKIMSVDETLDFMSVPGHSLVRFGDGEIMIISGKELPKYQKSGEEISRQVLRALNYTSNPNMLVCLPEILVDVNIATTKSQKYWISNIVKYSKYYTRYCKSDYTYGNAFVSRPYMIYKDKSKSAAWFSRLIAIFEDKDIVLVEGKLSRSGVGNDLFAKARSLRRILVPSQNAFSKYEEVKKTVLEEVDKNTLILLSAGPMSKPLCIDLFESGYWVIDIGHIDSEYEWFLADSKVKERNNNNFKHVAELPDIDIGDCTDPEYLTSILVDLS